MNQINPKPTQLRLPHDKNEWGSIYRRWDSLNGRYFITADIVLTDGQLFADVLFDGDTRIAVTPGPLPLSNFPTELLGREILALLITQDCSCGSTSFTPPTPEERARFRHARGHSSPGL